MQTLLPSLAALALASLTPQQPAAAPQAPTAAAAQKHSAVTPAERNGEEWWKQRLQTCNERIHKGDVGLIFLGDSITQGWEGEGRAVWEEFYVKRKAINLGFSGDRTQHVLWRIEHQPLEELAQPSAGKASPKLVVLMIGTNNSNGADNSAQEIGDGIRAIVAALQGKLPQAKVLVLGIFPRGEKPDAQRQKNAEASAIAAKLADGKRVHFLDIGPAFLEQDGTLSKEVMPDLLHLSPKGYRIWAEGIEAKVKELLGEK